MQESRSTSSSSPGTHADWQYDALLELRQIMSALRDEQLRAAAVAAEEQYPAALPLESDGADPGHILAELAQHEEELAELDCLIARHRLANESAVTSERDWI